MSIQENIKHFKRKIPDYVTLVAVSKTKSPDEILEAYYVGHKVFGENKVQELLQKQEVLPKDIEWHMVGHLQSNKVKYIAPFIRLIHSVDSLKLLSVINKEAIKNNRIIDCLLQIHIAREETKFGLSSAELNNIFESREYDELKNIRITGLMGMATFTSDEDLIRSEFRYLAGIFKEIKSKFFLQNDEFKEISMGMSADYQIAIEEGSTMLRVGTIIFGEREYH